METEQVLEGEEKLPFFRLPVRPISACFSSEDEEEVGDAISKTFVKERNAITRRNIRKFVRRWQAIWELSLPKKKLHPLNRRLVMGQFNANKLYDAYVTIHKRKSETGEPVVNNALTYHRMALNLILPLALLDAFRVSEHYNVSMNLAMVRIYVHQFPGYEGWGF